MSYISERVSYLNGLSDGLKLKDEDTAKLISGILDVLQEIASDLEERDDTEEDLLAAVDDLYESVEELQECCAECDACCPPDEPPYGCPTPFEDEEDDFAIDEPIMIQCPFCDSEFVMDEDELIEHDVMVCPNCGKTIHPEELDSDADPEDSND